MSNRLARSAGLIGLATMTSRVLGLVRDWVFAHWFGAGDIMDAFNVAARIPNLLRDLFAEGAMSSAFVPSFTRTVEEKGRDAAWRLGSQVVNALLLITGVIVVLGIIFVHPLMGSYAADYAKIPGKLELATQLARVTLPFLTLVAVAAALMGMLNGLRRFVIPSLSPAMFNVVMIASAITFVPICIHFGWPPIMSIAIGTVLGGLAQIVVQVPALRREGYRHQWVLNVRDKSLHQVLMLMGPGMIGAAAAQINLFVSTVLATSLGTGAVSYLTYSFRLMYVPIGIFGVSVATAAIPDLARHAAAEAYHDMRRTLSAGLRLMLMLSVPSAVGLMVLAKPISEMFQGGKFTSENTIAVAGALLFYAPGLIGYSIVKIAGPSFYALRDARTPIIISVITVISNLVLNLALVGPMGFRGLAFGTAISANINAGLLLWLLSRRIGGMDFSRVAIAFVKITIASAVMGAAAYYCEAWLHHLLPHRSMFTWLTRIGGSVAVALAVLSLAAWALRIDEFGAAIRRVLRRRMVSVPEEG